MPKTAPSIPSALRQQPLDLGPGEVGVEDQAGALAEELLVAGLPQLLAAVRGAAVLPDERVVDRLAAARIPGDDRLALVGDPDRFELGAADPGIGQRLAADALGHLPDLARVVLDPAGPGKVLAELRVGAAGDLALVVEDEAGAARGALIDREDHRRRAYPRPASRAGRGRRRGCRAPGAAVTEAGEACGRVARWARSRSISASRAPASTASIVIPVSIP